MLNFKSKYPIGIDIGSRNIYAVQLKETRQGFAVRALAHRELEAEIESIPDANPGLVDAVKKMTKNRNFRGKSAVLHIPVKNISVLPIRFKVGATETLEEAILRESEKYLSFPLEEAALDYPSLTPEVDGDGDAYRATVIAVRRKYIEQYLQLMKQAGLTVEAVDYRVSSLIRLYKHFHKVTKHPVILCYIGYFESMLAVVTEDSIIGQRIIPWGVHELIEKILANLELLKAKDNARLLLKTHGLAYEDLESADNSDDRAPDATMVNMRRAIFQVITPSIDELVFEFHKMISGVMSEKQHTAFEGIYMYGHAALIHHFDRYFERRLNIPTRCINPMTTVALSDGNKLPGIDEGAPFALALGLAMRKVTWL
ncbi:MAG: type IV pilus assembly protein PilM [Candidatus Desulfatibia sp.]|uniref:type IV pilus assembly protein PilM n=1 Tax=Candidatus Desulfatibia sp. TaxID=3101189 RepID=UPI002F30F358